MRNAVRNTKIPWVDFMSLLNQIINLDKLLATPNEPTNQNALSRNPN